VPFYGERTDLSFMFEPHSTSIDEASREGENGDANASNEQQLRKMYAVISGSVPQQKRVEVMTYSTSSHLDDSTCESWQHKNISQVYTRNFFGS
jgi:hypothetical protein